MEKGAALEADEQIKWQVFETGDANTRFMDLKKALTSNTPIVYIILGCGHRDTIWSAHCKTDKTVGLGRMTQPELLLTLKAGFVGCLLAPAHW